MKKRTVAILSALVIVVLLATLGWALNRGENHRKGEALIMEAFGEKAVFETVLDEKEPFYGKTYVGDHLFVSDTYEYLLNPEESQILAVYEYGTTRTEKRPGEAKLLPIPGQEEAAALMRACLPGAVRGDLSVNTYDHGDQSISYEIKEAAGEIRTGTIAMVTVISGKISTAAFRVGDYEKAASFDAAKGMTEEACVEAFEKYLIEMNGAEEDSLKEAKVQSELSLVNGKVCRILEIEAEVPDGFGGTFIAAYRVVMDAENGEIYEVATG